MNLRTLTVDPQGNRSCIVYLAPPDPERPCIIPITRDAYVAGIRDDLWSVVSRGNRLVVLDLTVVQKTTSYFAGVLIDVKQWLRTHRGDLRLSGLKKDLEPWFSVVLNGDPVYRSRMDALQASLRA